MDFRHVAALGILAIVVPTSLHWLILKKPVDTAVQANYQGSELMPSCLKTTPLPGDNPAQTAQTKIPGDTAVPQNVVLAKPRADCPACSNGTTNSVPECTAPSGPIGSLQTTKYSVDPCQSSMSTASQDGKISIRGIPVLGAGSDGTASGVFEVCNTDKAPLRLKLALGEFTALGAGGKPFLLNSSHKLSAVDDGDQAIVNSTNDMAANQCVKVRLDVGNLWQPGVAAATLTQDNQYVAEIKALRYQAPFQVKIDDVNPERLETSFIQGLPTPVRLRNEDDVGYRFRWQMQFGTLTVKDVGYIPPKGRTELCIFLPKENFRWLESGFLRPGVKQGTLTIFHDPGPAFENFPLESRNYPVTAALRYFSELAQSIFNVAAVLGVLLCGILASLVINYALPMQRRIVDVKQKLSDAAVKLNAPSDAVGLRTLKILRVEQGRLEAAVRDLSPVSPETETRLTRIEARIEVLVLRIELATAAVNCLTGLRNCDLLSMSEKEEITARCVAALNAAEKLSNDDVALKQAQTELSVAITAFDNRNELPRTEQVEELRTKYRKLLKTLPNISTNFSSYDPAPNKPVSTIMTALQSELQPLDDQNFEPTRNQYVQASLALWKMEILTNYMQLVIFAESENTRNKRLARLEELISRVSPGPQSTPTGARSTLRQIQQNVSAQDIVDILKSSSNTATICIDPPRPMPFQLVTMKICLPQPGLDESDARTALKCRWSVNDEILEGDGLCICHYFEPAGWRLKGQTNVFTVKAVIMDGTTELPPVQAQVHLQTVKDFVRSSTKLSLVNLGITVVLVTVGLLTAAQEKLQSIDWATGVVALLVLGFSTDVIKRALAKA